MDIIFRNFFGAKPDEIGQCVMFTCFDCIRSIKRAYKKHTIKMLRGFYSGITLKHSNNAISVINIGPGASSLGDAVLALRKSACNTVVYTGAVGGIRTNMNVGDIVIGQRAIIGEGFSNYYKHKDSFISFDDYAVGSSHLIDAFKKFYNKNIDFSYAYHLGDIFTIGTLFAETKEFLKTLQDRKVCAIDMETSAFFTAATVANLSSMAIHYISDLPHRGDEINIFNPACRRIYFQLPLIIMEFVINALLSK